MKTVTDEYYEQYNEEIEYMYEEYTESADATKKSAINSLKFYAVGYGISFLITCLVALFDSEFLLKINKLFVLIIMIGGLAVGFYFKGVKPTFKMFKYYWSEIMNKAGVVAEFLSIIPFVGLFINFVVCIFDIYIICLAIAFWLMCPPLIYFLAYLFYKRLSKGFKKGLEWHDRRKAKNYVDSTDKVEE